MPGTRIAIDGLWRCLCPSFDTSGYSLLKVPLGRGLARPCVGSIKQNRILWMSSSRPSTQPFHNHAASCIQRKSEVEGIVGTEPRAVFQKHKTASSLGARDDNFSYASLDDVPVAELHDILLRLKYKEGEYQKTLDLVNHLVQRAGGKASLLHYNALLSANADASHGSASAVAKLLQQMKDEGIVADSELYHSALQALAVHPDYVLRGEILGEMDERWFSLTIEGWHNLVLGLLRDRQYEIALDKLEHMQREGIRVQPWLYDIFIYLFCETDELDEALKILRYRVDYGDTDVSPNIWYYVLDACSSNYHYDGTRYVWEIRVEGNHINPSDGMCTNVLNTAARHCDARLATDVIRVLAGRKFKLDIYHYEALLEAYIGSKDLNTALRLLGIMKKSRLEPSESTTRPIHAYLTTSAHLPAKAWKILQQLRVDGHEVPLTAVNCVLEAYVSNGQHREALVKYKSVRSICPSGPNTATINLLLKNLTSLDDSKEIAMSLASEMASTGIRPNTITYDRLILVCLNEDDYEDAFKYLDEMKATFPGSELRPGTCQALLKLCAEKGDDRGWTILEDLEEKGQATSKMRSLMDDAWKGRGIL